jgi:glucose/arabinose dehydrogenase
MEQPTYYYLPSIAICGMDFISGDLFKKWKHYQLNGVLKYEEVRLLDIKENRVLHDEVILKNARRVRDVACGPDGAIYIVLDQPGKVLRLTPQK